MSADDVEGRDTSTIPVPVEANSTTNPTTTTDEDDNPISSQGFFVRLLSFYVGYSWVIPSIVVGLVEGYYGDCINSSICACAISWANMFFGWHFYKKYPKEAVAAEHHHGYWPKIFDILNVEVMSFLLPITFFAGDDFCQKDGRATTIYVVFMIVTIVTTCTDRPLTNDYMVQPEDKRKHPMLLEAHRTTTWMLAALFMIQIGNNVARVILDPDSGLTNMFISYIIPYSTWIIGTPLIWVVGKRTYRALAAKRYGENWETILEEDNNN